MSIIKFWAPVVISGEVSQASKCVPLLTYLDCVFEGWDIRLARYFRVLVCDVEKKSGLV